jgi:hypothetical protein
MRSKKVKRDKNYVSKVNKEIKEETKVKNKTEPQATPSVKNKVKETEPKATPSVKNKTEPKVTPSVKNKTEPKVTPSVKNKVKEIEPCVKNKSETKVKKSPDLLNKHGYNITNRSVDRQQSLGKLVILYGVSDLIKKIDSISVQNPNLTNKYNDDKRWIKNNFKSKKS